MTPRALLIGVLASGTVLAGVIIGALAIGIAHPKATIAAKAAVGSCAPYAGLPADQGDTAGMAFIPGNFIHDGLGAPPAGGAFHPHRARGRLLDRPP